MHNASKTGCNLTEKALYICMDSPNAS